MEPGKRKRPWGRQSSGSTSPVTAVAAAAAFALAAISAPRTDALQLSRPPAAQANPRSCHAAGSGRGSGGEGRYATAAAASSAIEPRRSHRHRQSVRILSSTVSSGGALPAAGASDHQVRPSASCDDQQARRGSGASNSGSGSSGDRSRDGAARAGRNPVATAAIAATTAEKSPQHPGRAVAARPLRPPPRNGSRNGSHSSSTTTKTGVPPPTSSSTRALQAPRPLPTARSAETTSTSTSERSIDRAAARKRRYERRRDNDVRMFFRERGLSKWEVRKVLVVVRRDPDLVSDIGALAARMQAIADLLEAAGSWYAPADQLAISQSGRSQEDLEAVHLSSTQAAHSNRRSSPPATAPSDGSVDGTCGAKAGGRGSRTGIGKQQQGDGVSFHPATASGKANGAPAIVTENDGGGGGGGGGGGVRNPNRRHRKHRGGPATAAGASTTTATPAADAAPREGRRTRTRATQAEGEGEESAARLHAYQLVSSEPRLLLLLRPGSDPDLLSGRLRFLLDAFPSLRGSDDCCRCCWNAGAPLKRAAPLLAIDSATLGERLEGLAEMLPPSVDVQAIVNQAPLLLRQSTEALSEALANTERLIPGLRMDRMLRSAPQLLVQPSDVVERRLAHLREVLGLTPSPTLERMRIAAEAQQIATITTTSGGGRRLARFANAFPQILTMDPNTVQAKIEGLEDLLPGVDGLAVVSSRPQLLGFDVWRNVSLKVSRLRELMTRARVRQGPKLPRHRHQQHQEQGRQGMHQDGSKLEGQRRRGRRRQIVLPSDTTASDDLAAAVTRCPSLLTLSSDTTMRKVQEFQEALPSGLDARTIVAKEPRVLALDMGSTVPRKLEDLMRAFGEHASYADTTTAASAAPEGEDDDRRNEPGTGRGETSGGEATAAALTTAPIADGVMAEVLRYFPNALRFEPATLARKLEALQRAGLPPGVALEVVRGAPRCLSVAEGTLERRVSALREAFPSIPLSRLLGEAPCLLQNKIEPAAKVEVLQDLFPSLDPVSLVEGAPMLLALSPSTLRVKADAWRHVLEGRLGVPWEQAIAEFPQLLCQGLGRAARVAFLLLALDDERTSAATIAASEDTVAGSAPHASAFQISDGGGAAVKAVTSPTGGKLNGGESCSGSGDCDGDDGSNGVGAGKRMSAATACREICRRVSDFESDHPSYPAFLDSLLLGASLYRSVRTHASGEPEKETTAGALISLASPAAEGTVLNRGSGRDANTAAAHGPDEPYYQPIPSDAGAGGYAAAGTAAGASDVETGLVALPRLLALARKETGEQQLQHRQYHRRQLSSDRHPASPTAPTSCSILPVPSSEPPSSIPTTIAVRSEKALSAAMAEAARGPGGGGEAAAMLFPDKLTPLPR